MAAISLGVAVRIEGHDFGEVDGGFFGVGEAAGGCVPEGFDLGVGPAETLADSGVRGQAVGRAIALRGADDDQFLERLRQRAGIQDGVHVGDDGLEDLRPVSHGAEHVGDVAAVAQGAVVDDDG
jgi:hypothetical protein